MYGIMNKAIEDLVSEKFGLEEWEAVKEKSGIDIDFFISNEAYEDAITFELIGSAAEVLGLTEGQVLFDLGEWWVLKTVREKYGDLMTEGGNSLKDFLLNLPMFYNRILLMYPKLTPPEFKVSDVTGNTLLVHYHTKRTGLREFVRGILSGLAKMFHTEANIELVQSREAGSAHDVFKISWK